MNPLFSIIVPHYDQVITDSQLLKLLDQLNTQHNPPEFEVLVYHDGPESRQVIIDPSIYKYPLKYRATSKRYNDFGHSLRDLGVKEAKGEYIIHINPDNTIRNFFLEELVNKITEEDPLIPNNIIIFCLEMKGMVCDGKAYYRTNDARNSVILTGYPAVMNNIDCMQLVMKRSLWLSVGGWYDKSPNSDGQMYEVFVRKHKARYIPIVLATHY
jgi:hypothetical protein